MCRALLRTAAAEKRTLITIDTDFGEIVFVDHKPHAGLLRLPATPAETRIAILRQILEAYTPDVINQSVITVRGGRIRVTRSDI